MSKKKLSGLFQNIAAMTLFPKYCPRNNENHSIKPEHFMISTVLTA